MQCQSTHFNEPWMKNPITCEKPTVAALADRLKAAASRSEYQPHPMRLDSSDA